MATRAIAPGDGTPAMTEVDGFMVDVSYFFDCLADGADHALAVGAITRRGVHTIGIADVDVVEGRGEFVAFLIADLIGPCGNAGQRGIGLILKQVCNLQARGFRQLTLGQLTHQPVAQRTPRMCRHAHDEEAQAEKNSHQWTVRRRTDMRG